MFRWRSLQVQVRVQIISKFCLTAVIITLWILLLKWLLYELKLACNTGLACITAMLPPNSSRQLFQSLSFGILCNLLSLLSTLFPILADKIINSYLEPALVQSIEFVYCQSICLCRLLLIKASSKRHTTVHTNINYLDWWTFGTSLWAKLLTRARFEISTGVVCQLSRVRNQ